MSSRSALDLSTRTVKIYASAFDATARADIEEHLLDISNPHDVTADQIGLGNADNTSDADKPVSTAQAAALALKAPLASPALSGVPTAPTAPVGTVTVQLATTAYAYAAANDAIANMAVDDTPLADHLADHANPHVVTKSQIGLALVDNTADMAKPVSVPQQDALALKAPLVSPALSGLPTAPTAPTGTITQQLATTAFVQAAINTVIIPTGDDLAEHLADVANPHSVTKTQVGLGNVDNTSDIAKPVSDATQLAINAAVAGVGAGTIADDLAAHLADADNPHVVTKTQLGLALVDNTTDLTKPVSSAQQTAINVAAAIGNAAQADIDGHQANVSNPHAVTKAQIGLANVDNTADLAKPISSATQIALNLKVSAASPALTGTPTAPTAAPLTNTTQLATTAYADAAVGIVQAEVDDAAAAAAAAQAAADAAQADATQALADAAEALAAAESPGDAVALYGETKTGEAAAAVPIDPAWAVTSPAGNVIRVVAAVADDPQTIAPISPISLVPGRIYDVIYRVQRIVDPLDPLNDSVTCGIQWLTNTKAGNGSATVDDIPLVIADGVVERRARIGIAPPIVGLLDHTAPAGTVYFRPFIDLYGGDAHTTDVITLDVQDVTAAAGCCGGSVNVITPAEASTVILTDQRPVYVNNAAPMAAVFFRLPANGHLLEIGFRNPVTQINVQNAAGDVIEGSPTNAYGPGSALFFRYVSDAVRWVYWK